MLPSGKFSRIALAGAALLAALLLCAVGGLRSPWTSHLASNLIQTAILLWAAVCTAVVARRSSGYLRQLWQLLAAAFVLLTAGEAMVTYLASFHPAPAATPWPSDILTFIWVVPVAMMLLPYSAEPSGTIHWQRTLDFIQAGIVALTAYLYFFYVPSLWETQGLLMFRRLMEVDVTRDVLLAAGFRLRAVSSRQPVIRAFFTRMSALFFTVGIADFLGISQLGQTGRAAEWTGAAWCVPYLFATVLAATWDTKLEREPEAPAAPVGGWVASQALPVCIPLLVLFMGPRIATEQMTIAWVAIGASFACSAARLILTNETQHRIAEDLRRTEQALRRSEHMFAAAFRGSPDAISISLFPEGKIVELNESFTKLTGYSREESLGKTPEELGLWADPSRMTKLRTRFREQGEIRYEDFQFRRKDGEVRFGRIAGASITLDGRPCALVIVRDITESKKAEEGLRKSEERFRTLVRDLQVGVLLLRPDGEIQFANSAALQMFGLSEDQFVGKTPSELDLIPLYEDGTEMPLSARPVARAIETRQPIRGEVMGWRRKDSGDVLWILGNAIPQLTQSGEVATVIASFADITEQKRTEEALRQLSTRLLQLQDEERRRLGRDLHDSLAQSVLAVNLSLAQVTQGCPALDDRSRQVLGEARGLLQDMSRQIRTLSYLLHPPLLDELGLASAVKEYASGFSERSGILLEVGVSPGFGRLPQDTETALFRIVQESLANIQRHSGSRTARIRLNGNPTGIILEVSDQGRGISEAKGKKLNETGTRFGVGIVGMRERMAQLGGTLEIESSKSGTTVRATLPLKTEVLHAASHPRGR